MNAVARKKDKLADVVVKEIPDMDDLNYFLVNTCKYQVVKPLLF